MDTRIDPREYMANAERPAHFYVDSLVHDQRTLAWLVELMGRERVTLGTDYPFPLGELEPGALIESVESFSTDDKAWLLHKTALEFLGLPADAFGAS